MSEEFISSQHVEKLGHALLEVRQRALRNVISKLNRGFTFDNNLARSKQILAKLLEWFLYDPCTQEEEVFELMKRILQSEGGVVLVRHYTPNSIKKEVEKLREYTEPKFHRFVDEILRLIEQQSRNVSSYKPNVMVPPLESEVPLSYRTGQSDVYTSRSADVMSINLGTTATPIEVSVRCKASVEPQAGKPDDPYSCPETYTLRQNEDTDDHTNSRDHLLHNCLQNVTLYWQQLIEADRHVLNSVETSLKNPQQPSALMDSCQFFKDVLLHDFPAEVFLQRPSIVQYFHKYVVMCPSTRITNSILECLLELTCDLQVRIKLVNDASIYNFKDLNLYGATSVSNSPSAKSSTSDGLSSDQRTETVEDIALLKDKQLTTFQFTFYTMQHVFKYLTVTPEALTKRSRSNINQNGVNIAIQLLSELINLLKLCVDPRLLNSHQTDYSRDFVQQLVEVLVDLGDLLDHFRIESDSNDEELNYRAIYLCLCNHCATLLECTVAKNKSAIVVPRNLKNTLSNCIIDVTLARLYPRTHRMLLEYVQDSSSNDSSSDLLRKYKLVDNYCASISATANLMQNHKGLKASESLCLAKKSLQSLDFHRDLRLLKVFVDICANKVPLYKDNADICQLAEDITLCLLSNNLEDVREEIYRLCQRQVINAIGPKLNITGCSSPGSQVLFLLRPKVVTEICLFGITSQNIQIQKFSEDILVHIVKCKILVSDDIWSNALEAILLSMPLLLCHCSRNSSLGRTLLEILDPDVAHRNCLPTRNVLIGNIELMYSKDASIREEVFSRLCWCLSSQPDAREYLPRLNNLNDKALATVCQLKKTLDINRSRNMQHFYQPSNVQQVMDVLKSNNVEPVIRRSALTQISVMLEDPILQQTFLDNDGISVVVNVMRSALIERHFQDYPDSIIPAVSILKNVCFHHSSARHELSVNEEALYCILRGLFMFFTEERLRQEASTLLFLLVFSDFCTGCPSSGTFSLPLLVHENFAAPFKCRSHWTTSQYTDDSLLPRISSDRWCLSAIRMHWNLEMLGGLRKVLVLTEASRIIDSSSPQSTPEGDGDRISVHLTKHDIKALKASSLDCCIGSYLVDIQNGTSHKTIINVIQKLTLYVHLYNAFKRNEEIDGIQHHPWNVTFSKFLKLLPSSEDDVKLLTAVVQFLIILVDSYDLTDRKTCWVNAVLKDPCLLLLDIIHVDPSTSESTKLLSSKILVLITNCVCKEQHYLDFYPETPDDMGSGHPWRTVIQNIAESLRNSDTQHFYNLAYLDSLLSCLVHLTAMLGWSKSRPDTEGNPRIGQLIAGLCELVNAFHHGKGPTASVSLMGLNITRNVLLILNHLLAELQYFKVKGWEHCFLPELNEKFILNTFVSLLSSRDVILRAAALQLFAGLSVSSRVAISIVGDVCNNRQNIWEVALAILVDTDEACIVKENAAVLLANLASHTAKTSSDKYVLITGVDPSKIMKENISTNSIWNYLDEYQFYSSLELYTTCIFTNDIRNWTSLNNKSGGTRNSSSAKSWSSTSSSKTALISTPGLLKSIIQFLSHLFILNCDQVTNQLHEHGLVKLLLKCLTSPNTNVSNTKELSCYCDILEMDTVICHFLSQVVVSNRTCLGTVLNTRDCLNVMISLLNPKLFYTHLPQLVYLRNRLWSEIFHLIGILIECGTDTEGKLSHQSTEALNTFLDVLLETGKQPFLETLCEAVGATGSHDLQNSALCSLTSLLKVETSKTSSDDLQKSQSSERMSMQDLLDNSRTPRTMSRNSYIDDNDENKKPNVPSDKTLRKKTVKGINRINLLEDIYFAKMFKEKVSRVNEQNRTEDSAEGDNDDMPMAGSELCKILLHLFDLCNLHLPDDDTLVVSPNMVNTAGCLLKRSSVLSALTNLLKASREAKGRALREGLLVAVLRQLRQLHVRLSLRSVDCLKRAGDRRRVLPVLRELLDLVGLLTNFMAGEEAVKCEGAELGVADLTHKLWAWFCSQRVYLVDGLRMLATYTADCETACYSMLLTSNVAGTGPRKTPTNLSLLHVILDQITKEMDKISRTHDLTVLQLCFDILENCTFVQECRVTMSKSPLMQSMSRLHPAITKRQKPWDNVERLWLEFLQTYTTMPEGQASVAKIPDVLEVLMSLTTSGKEDNKFSALTVLRNIAFHQSNRPRLLMTGEFLNILHSKLTHGGTEEKNLVTLIMWALSANNQKGKVVLKCAKLDAALEDALKHLQLLSSGSATCLSRSRISDNGSDINDIVDRMCYVLSVLRDGDKYR